MGNSWWRSNELSGRECVVLWCELLWLPGAWLSGLEWGSSELDDNEDYRHRGFAIASIRDNGLESDTIGFF